MLATATPAQALVANQPVQSWETNGRVTAILKVDGIIYIAGRFTAIDDRNGTTIQRNHAAAFIAKTGAPTMWNPNANYAVVSLAASPNGDVIYAGGDFTRIGGLNRSRIAALDAVSGEALPRWKTTANKRVMALAVSGSMLIMGGNFSGIGGQTRRAIGAVSLSDGSLRNWYPSGGADGEIRSMAIAGNRLVVVGTFTHVGGRSGNYIAGIDVGSGNATSWSSHPNQFGIVVTSDGSSVYVGTKDNHVAKYFPSNGNKGWSSHGDGNIQGLTVMNGVTYVGGHFTEFDGTRAPHIAAFDSGSGHRITWDVNVNSNLGIFAMESGDGVMCIGGDFTRVNGRVQQSFAMFKE